MVTLSVGNWYIQVSGLSVTRLPYTYSLPHVFNDLQAEGMTYSPKSKAPLHYHLR